MKRKVYDACCAIIIERIQSLKQQLHDLVEGAKSDSKSTAGDKHETARAMMQIEQEKLSNQLKILESQQHFLQCLNPNIHSEIISNGSLVQTDRGWIYLSVPLGKISVDDVDVMCLSSQSPLGIKLTGKRVGEKVEMNGVPYNIECVY